MLSAIQTPVLFVVKEKPSVRSVLGAMLIVCGAIFGIGTLLQFSNSPRQLFAFWILFWLFVLGAGLLIVIYEPAAKILIDRKKRQVRLTCRAILGWNRRVLNFSEIKYFRLIENRDTNGDSHSVIGLELRNGEILTIIMLPDHVEEFECRYILEINEFLRKDCERLNR